MRLEDISQQVIEHRVQMPSGSYQTSHGGGKICTLRSALTILSQTISSSAFLDVCKVRHDSTYNQQHDIASPEFGCRKANGGVVSSSRTTNRRSIHQETLTVASSLHWPSTESQIQESPFSSRSMWKNFWLFQITISPTICRCRSGFGRV